MFSIVLPFKNALATIDECLDSIRQQTFIDFELIAVNDHSTDDSPRKILDSADARFHVFNNRGTGIVDALNYGISQARADWIVRMDADDVMSKHRLAATCSAIAKNPKVDCVSSKVRLFPEQHVSGGMNHYIRWQNAQLSHQEIVDGLYQESTLTHPSVSFHREIWHRVGGYRNGDFPEDYDLWFRFANIRTRFHKIDECLLDWREHHSKLTRTDARYDIAAFDSIRQTHLLKDSRLLDAEKILIWGAGRITRKRTRPLFAQGLNITAWIDIDPKKIGQTITGIPVIAPDNLTPTESQLILVYVNSHNAKEKIRQFLEQRGFLFGRDFLFVG